jgi:hypothetical protein
MLDPTTGEPIVINLENMTLLTMPARNHAARRIINATEIQVGDGAVNTTATRAGNTVSQYGHVSSRFLYRALIASGVTAVNAAKYHFLGDFKKAFAYMENWPITVTRAPDQQRGGIQRRHRRPVQSKRTRRRRRPRSLFRGSQDQLGSVQPGSDQPSARKYHATH